MCAYFFITLLLGLAASAPCAQAQPDYATPIYFESLTGYQNLQYAWPAGVAVDSRRNVYFIFSGQAVQFWMKAPGAALRPMLNAAPSEISGSCVAVDPADNVYMLTGGTLRKAAADGTTTVLSAAGAFVSETAAGARARFPGARAIAVDAGGNIYAACGNQQTILKAAPGRAVVVLAGASGQIGSGDGALSGDGISSARFNYPSGIAVDGNGTVFVADSLNHTLRRIAPDGTVATLAGSPGSIGGQDGAGDAARFKLPVSLALGASGTLYATDHSGRGIRRISPEGIVSSLAIARPPGDEESWGELELYFSHIAIDRDGNFYLTDDWTASVLVSVLPPASRLTNLAIRSRAGTGPQSLIVGFVVGGMGATGSPPLLIRGVGPALGAFGVAGALADPALEIISGATVVASNDNWNGDAQVAAVAARVGAFPLASATSRDAALHHAGLAAGAYTVQLSGVGGATGAALVEIYDATPPSAAVGYAARLLNVSARAHVGIGADILIAGFGVSGTAAGTVLIRAVGPGLDAFGVAGALSDPHIVVVDSAGRVVAENDNWSAGGAAETASLTAATAKVGAFALVAGSRDAALLGKFPPGAYTVHVSGVGAATGISLVEVYHVP
jgi:hypothetical protein